ncbi:hypothetical protein KHP62_14135 [Rhodobacteraceae bacterium NNCM2]|nr:hypothetical protein [Coraliihabitans acroporae]
MEELVNEYAGIPEFSERLTEFRQNVVEKKDQNEAWKKLWKSWDEFRETIVVDDIDGDVTLRNSIRPGSFMNIEDLGFGAGVYRIFPNFFVSAGLFLTFLGLVAALHEFSQSMTAAGNGGMDSAMTNFMQIASAKFIMSLVALLCSIIFTIVLRVRSVSLERKLHDLCLTIERRLDFVSLEDLGFRQLKAATEQREYLREIGMGMVAELKAPLETLPEKITSSIADRMDPIFERVSSIGESSMEGLVGDLSSQLSQSVGNALNRASESLGEATDRIGAIVDKMDRSNEQAGEGLNTALQQMAAALAGMRADIAASGQTASATMNEGAEKLLGVMNETLASIRDNTSQGAQALSSAADNLKNAAEGFREQISAATADGISAVEQRMASSSEQAGAAIEGAGKTLLASFESTSQGIARLGDEMGETIGEELLTRIEAVCLQFDEVAAAVKMSAAGAQSAAVGLNDGAQAIAGASTSFNNASQDMVRATTPLRASHERIEASVGTLGRTVETVAETLLQDSSMIAKNAESVLAAAQTALETEREGIRTSLEATKAVFAQLSNEADKLDRIDEMLGHGPEHVRPMIAVR